MIKLIITSILWAFSFSLIGVYLSGKVDTYLAIVIRFTLGLLTLLPFFKPHKLPFKTGLKLMGIGALQVGLMYIFFFESFKYLKVPEVILFTVTTPIIIAIIGDLIEGHFNIKYFGCALLAVLGAALIKWNAIGSNFYIGLVLITLCNLCFGLGQLLYKKVIKEKDLISLGLSDINIFSYFYIGALMLCLPLMLLKGDMSKFLLETPQVLSLLWLGIMASGVGYVLWNTGSREVNHGTLAVMNNLIVPLGIIINIVIWDNEYPLTRLVIGSFLILISVKLTNKTSMPKGA